MSVLSFVERVFPSPQSMSFASVGIDVSDTSLKYIQFERKHAHNKYLVLKYWGDIDVPPGVVERGNVHDEEKLAEVLRQVRARTGTRYVHISLPEERAYLFETVVAKDASPKDIHGLLEFKLEENVPLSPRDAYFDYDVVGVDKETGMLRVAVAVYAQSTINSYYTACERAELVPLSFEIEAQAIARSSVPLGHEQTALVVDFGKTRMGVGIVHRGVLMYTSTIEIAGAQMSQDLRGALGDVPEAELTQLKNTKGLSRIKGNEAVADICEKFAQNIAEELSVRIHYWHTRGIDTDERQIKRVILCGGSANLFGLPEYLSERLDIKTERAHVWDNAFSLEKSIPPITRKYSYGYATAIGLALRNFTHL